MKLLLVSDLHRDGKKLLWLLEEAPAHDALVVAGDLLDIFSNTATRLQIEGTQRYRDAILEQDRWLVWCSGNHDFPAGEKTTMDQASPAWMREGDAPNFVRDGETRRIGAGDDSMIVTTLPWPVKADDILVDGASVSYLEHIKALLHTGHSLREETRAPWMILHHEPPAETAISAGYDAAEAAFSRRIIAAAGPDFSVHGHIHEAYRHEAGGWFDRIGRTACFNAGQTPPGHLPNAILLETKSDGEVSTQWFIEGKANQPVHANR